jgi:hypothetical protein
MASEYGFSGKIPILLLNKGEATVFQIPILLKAPFVVRNLMKLFLFTMVIGSFLFSCKGQNSASGEITSFVDPIDTSKGVHHVDSLDLDTSSFITTNFPDTVHKVLYNPLTHYGFM